MQTSIQNLLRVRFIGHNKFISLYLTYGSQSHITKTRPVEWQDVYKIYVHLLAPHSCVWLFLVMFQVRNFCLNLLM